MSKAKFSESFEKFKDSEIKTNHIYGGGPVAGTVTGDTNSSSSSDSTGTADDCDVDIVDNDSIPA